MLQKARFGQSSDGVGAKKPVLVVWFIIGLFVAFQPAGRQYDLSYTALFLWCLELLVVYLAVDNAFFQRIISWMLFSIGLTLLILYHLEETSPSKSFNKIEYVLILSIWHFIAFLIAVITNYFNKKLKNNTKKYEHN
ncbi:MAG: hypothetical protein OEY19_10370 [Gammaproteobacteria bacterium]|nr:hypothetical protein [Gammaproteobacteria bacterium]